MNKERIRRTNKREITLAGKIYPVYTDMAAWLDFETQTGRPLLGALTGGELTMTDTMALLWACIGGTDCGLTVRELAGLIDVADIGTAIEAVMAGWEASMPQVVEGEESEGKQQDPPASGTSGQSPDTTSE